MAVSDYLFMLNLNLNFQFAPKSIEIFFNRIHWPLAIVVAITFFSDKIFIKDWQNSEVMTWAIPTAGIALGLYFIGLSLAVCIENELRRRNVVNEYIVILPAKLLIDRRYWMGLIGLSVYLVLGVFLLIAFLK